METIDDTGFGGIRLIQDTEGFRYGIDAVLLSDFAEKHCPGARSVVELGCGNGVVSLLLAGKNEERQVTGIDFQEDAIRLAQRSSELNGLEERAHFLHCDIADLKERYPQLSRSASLVVSNPPYIARGSGIPGSRSRLLAARQETTADLDAFLQAAAWLLQGKGSFCLVHRPSRLVDILYGCRKHRLEPKQIRFVHPREGEPPNILLLHCVLDGGRQMEYEAPLYVYGADGGYSEQVLQIYGKSREFIINDKT